MTQAWPNKAAADIVERYWAPEIPDGDGVASVSTSATGVTVDSTEIVLGAVTFTLSAGVNGTTGSVTATATTTEGLSLSEMFLIPIRVTTVQAGDTARDVCGFALRKIVGNGNDPEATELDDALERLNDMVALWALGGVDTGPSAPWAAGDVLAVPDGFLAALKFNLRIACHDHYGEPVSAYDAQMAEASLRAVRNSVVQLEDLAMPQNLRRRWPFVATA